MVWLHVYLVVIANMRTEADIAFREGDKLKYIYCYLSIVYVFTLAYEHLKIHISVEIYVLCFFTVKVTNLR